MAKTAKETPAEDRLFAAAVKRRRDAAGMTQRQLADRIGVPERTVYLIEAVQRGVTRGEAVAIARAFGTTVEELVEPISAAAARAGNLAGSIARELESDIHGLLDAALQRAAQVRSDVAEAVREIDELPRVQVPRDTRVTPEQLADATDRYYAEQLADALYVIERLPVLTEAVWAAVQDFMTGQGSTGALKDVLTRADRIVAEGKKA